MAIKVHAVMWREDDIYVIKDVYTGVTTQGRTPEEAEENLKEALELYFEEFPELQREYAQIIKRGLRYGTIEVAPQPVG